MKRLIIFDCDGTLTVTKSGATFRKTADDWQWLPGRLEKLQSLQAQGVHLGIATNQGGVAFGHLDEWAMRTQLQRMADCVPIHSGMVAMCFTHPKASINLYRVDSDRRKPGPGMLLELIHNADMPAKDTLMVGDRPEDEQAAKAAGVDFMWADTFFGDEQEAQ